MRKLTAAIVFAPLTTAGGAGAAEINALISTAVADAMAELVPQFERASGHTLRITYGPSGGVAKRLTDGEAGRPHHPCRHRARRTDQAGLRVAVT